MQQLWILVAHILIRDGLLRTLKQLQRNLDSLDIEVLHPLLVKYDVFRQLDSNCAVNWSDVVQNYLATSIDGKNAGTHQVCRVHSRYCEQVCDSIPI